MSFHKTIVLGNIGADAEVGEFGGNPSVSFRIAASEKWTDKNNNKQEHTEWYRCTAYGKRFANVAPFLTKGAQILVEGKLRTKKVEDKFYTNLIVDNIQLAGGKKTETEASGD